MRVSKLEELTLIRTGLESLRKARHSRIMRSRAEVADAREYIVLCALLERVETEIANKVIPVVEQLGSPANVS